MFGGLSLLASAIAAPVFAATATSTTSAKPKVDVACMQSAIAARETSIASAFAGYSSSISTALATRASAFASAWGLTNAKARNTALKAAWKAYRSVASSARSTWSKSRQAAWTAFYNTRKTCGSGAAAEDTTTHSVDASL